jgi:hypothetical protein
MSKIDAVEKNNNIKINLLRRLFIMCHYEYIQYTLFTVCFVHDS